MKFGTLFPLPLEIIAKPDPDLRTGVGSTTPASASLDKCLEIFARVRTWRITMDVRLGDGLRLSGTAVVVNHGDRNGDSPQNESEVLLAGGTEVFPVLEDGDGGSLFLRTWEDVDAIHGVHERGVQFKYHEGLWLPIVQVGFDFGDFLTSVRPVEDEQSETPQYVRTTIECTYAGLPVPIFAVVDEIDPTEYSGKIEISAASYWQYANNDGTEPWWDKDTGKPLPPNPYVGNANDLQ